MTYKITIESLGEDDMKSFDAISVASRAREILAKFPTFKNTVATHVEVKRNRDCFPSVEWRVVFVVLREVEAAAGHE